MERLVFKNGSVINIPKVYKKPRGLRLSDMYDVDDEPANSMEFNSLKFLAKMCRLRRTLSRKRYRKFCQLNGIPVFFNPKGQTHLNMRVSRGKDGRFRPHPNGQYRVIL